MAPELRFRDRAALLLQREVGRLLAPLWVPVVVGVMRFGMGWRIEGKREARERFRKLRRGSPLGLLVCANHLTMVDSFVIAWALAPAWWYVLHYASVAWNTPERENFARTWPMRFLVYVMKCIPVRRLSALLLGLIAFLDHERDPMVLVAKVAQFELALNRRVPGKELLDPGQ